ncbi:hypothetical protein BZA05DRAFT_319115, partial [Tricharina praecox]|uniref:uncharacterized protein n=1 Tax=Tricharina praecox TaxID=43433 RepID=UPI00221F3CB7
LQKLWEHVEFGHVGRKGLRTGKGLELNCKWGTCEVRCKRRCYILSHLRVHIPHKQWPCPVCLKDPAAANYGPKVFKRNFDLGKH